MSSARCSYHLQLSNFLAALQLISTDFHMKVGGCFVLYTTNHSQCVRLQRELRYVGGCIEGVKLQDSEVSEQHSNNASFTRPDTLLSDASAKFTCPSNHIIISNLQPLSASTHRSCTHPDHCFMHNTDAK